MAVQRYNRWRSVGPYRTGLVRLQPVLFLTLAFNPRIFTTGVFNNVDDDDDDDDDTDN